jgi:hypothetical protein
MTAERIRPHDPLLLINPTFLLLLACAESRLDGTSALAEAKESEGEEPEPQEAGEETEAKQTTTNSLPTGGTMALVQGTNVAKGMLGGAISGAGGMFGFVGGATAGALNTMLFGGDVWANALIGGMTAGVACGVSAYGMMSGWSALRTTLTAAAAAGATGGALGAAFYGGNVAQAALIGAGVSMALMAATYGAVKAAQGIRKWAAKIRYNRMQARYALATKADPAVSGDSYARVHEADIQEVANAEAKVINREMGDELITCVEYTRESSEHGRSAEINLETGEVSLYRDILVEGEDSTYLGTLQSDLVHEATHRQLSLAGIRQINEATGATLHAPPFFEFFWENVKHVYGEIVIDPKTVYVVYGKGGP